MGGIPGTYSFAQRQQALGLLEQGLPALEVARRIAVDRRAVGRWAKVAGMTFRWGPSVASRALPHR